MKKFLNLMKINMPNRQDIRKSLSVFLVIGFLITYIGITIYKQDTLLPKNPLDEFISNISQVHLSNSNRNSVHAEEMPNEDIDEIVEEETTDTDREKGAIDKETDKNIHEENEKDNSLHGASKSKHNSGHRNKEITEDGFGSDKFINEYFITSIEENKVVTEQNYSFNIKQLNHDYTVNNIHVSIYSFDGKVISVTDDYSKPVHVNLMLAEKENRIRVSVTYEDEKEKLFTVSRTYVVQYDKDNIVIQSDVVDQQVVYREDFTFHANAKLGSDNAPVNVKVNSEEVLKTGRDKYTAKLKEGKNKITIESLYKGRKATKKYIVEYRKPQLKIKTNLKDQTVDQSELDFIAKALDGKQRVNLSIIHGKNVIEENKEGNYSVDLLEGENIFKLTATRGDVTHSETYVVIYNPHASGGGDKEENENAPIIQIYDISDGQKLRSSSYTFHVRSKTYKGDSITAGNGTISARNNGTPIKVNWLDGDQISFTLAVQSGENRIVIESKDNEGNIAIKSFTVYGDLAEEGEAIGNIKISIEATTIGLGYVIAPETVEIYQGENGAHMLDRLLKNHGYDYDHTGTLESSFYLSAIYKPGIVTNPVIPADLAELLERDMERFDPDDFLPDSLGEFDFTNGSGWMYSVNGNYPNVGFSDYIFKEGDEVRIRFTLAYGADIGGGPPGSNYNKEW